MLNKLKTTLALVAFAAVSFSLVKAQPQLIEKVEPRTDGLVIPYEKWKLPNGLTVIVHEDHSDPVVYVSVTYKVGSDRESIGRSGFAHYFEHYMFEGSGHVAQKDHFKIISTAGGELNGNTTRDRTVYWEILPSNQVETALWLESDRMGFLLDSIDQKKFDLQRDAVKNEKGQGENQPYGLVSELKDQALYPLKHPYNWQTIGFTEDLNRATLDDIKNFFLRWYGPNNAILTVAGDVDTKQVVQMAEKYFGPIKPCPEVKKLKVPAPILPSDKYSSYKDNIYLPLTMRVYPTVPLYHRDEPALDVLAYLMGDGNNSIFYKNFVKSKTALQAIIQNPCSELAGEYMMFILAYPPDDMNFEKLFNDLDAKIKSTIDEFEKTGITDEGIQRAKASYESRFISEATTVQNKADLLSEWDRLIGKPFNLSDQIDRYNKVTKEDVERVFNKYIKGAGAAVVNVYPKMDSKDTAKSYDPYLGMKATDDAEYAGLKYSRPVDNFDRSKRPEPSSAKVPQVPDYYTSQLKNGMKVIGTKFSETPTVDITINLEGGDLVLTPEESKKIGIAELAANVMNESTQKYTTEQISAELEKIGSVIRFSADKQNTSVYVHCLKKNLDPTLKLLEEKLLRPKFDAEDFKRVKKQYREELRSEKTEPNTIARRAYNQVLYGENTAWGSYATAKGIDKLELEDVKSYYNKYYSPSVASLIIVGDVDEKEIMPKLDFLNNWAAKEVKMPPVPSNPAPTEPQVYVVDKEFAQQTVIAMGEVSLPFDATGDFFKNRIANFALGGAFNSRLNLDLREEKGYTYGISSIFTGNKYTGQFSILTSVKRSATGNSLKEVIKDVKEYVDNGVTDAEVDFTKKSLLNGEALKYEAPNQKVSFLSQIVKYNLSKDFTVQQNQVLKNMTKDDFNQQIKKYINPNKMAIIMVGDKEIIKDQLGKLNIDVKDPNQKTTIGKIKNLSLD